MQFIYHDDLACIIRVELTLLPHSGVFFDPARLQSSVIFNRSHLVSTTSKGKNGLGSEKTPLCTLCKFFFYAVVRLRASDACHLK